jgi:hypothetical protein
MGDVEGTGWDSDTRKLLHLSGKPLGDRHATRADPDESEVFDTPVVFEDLVRDAGETS